MRQLQPKTILAVGLSCSLLLNTIVAGLVFSFTDPLFADPVVATAILSLSVWLLLNVPITLGMALVRSRIGKRVGKHAKIKTAIICCLSWLTFAMCLLAAAYLTMDYWTFDREFVGVALVLAAVVSLLLVIITFINIIVRCLSKQTTTAATA